LGEGIKFDAGLSSNLYKLLGEDTKKDRKSAKDYMAQLEEEDRKFTLVSIDEDE
jgi:hypothetical protein